MTEIEITRMSSKGQVVIPIEMRKDIKEGEKLLIIKSGNQIILKKANKMDEQMKEDIEFAKRTEEAWKEIESGKCTTMEVKDFLKEMKKW
jgi:AbrB family looped-hinge helix DNA binding protein